MYLFSFFIYPFLIDDNQHPLEIKEKKRKRKKERKKKRDFLKVILKNKNLHTIFNYRDQRANISPLFIIFI